MDDVERIALLRRVHHDTDGTAQRERHRDYSVSSAGRRFGPSRGNWSSWKVSISAIARR